MATVRLSKPLLFDELDSAAHAADRAGDSAAVEEDSSKPLNHFLASVEADDLVTFKAKFGRAFLVRWTQDYRMMRPAGLGSPDWKKTTQVGMVNAPEPGAPAMQPDGFFVYCVRPRDRRTPGPISVGRSHRSDVWIADVSVSTHHAEIEIGPEDAVSITDRGSTNGTFVGNEVVEFGETAVIPFGKTVRIGSVKLTCMPAKQFVDFVKLMAKPSA